jgi:predicted  nucleic acid-binding Zn-ribbon protein
LERFKSRYYEPQQEETTMPTSITPEPGENEFECARCGAYFHYELTRCPNCGVNLYEPEDEADEAESPIPRGAGVFSKLKDVFHRVFNKPYSADEIFGDALDQAVLYNDLLQKVRGDRAAVDRLIEFERARAPKSTRRSWIQSASQRWERDNHNLNPDR